LSLSRLRLRLAFSFSLVFAIGLIVCAAGALGYMWRESHRRLDARLDSVLLDVQTNLAAELKDSPESNVHFITSEVVNEWPRNEGSFVICDSSGNILASTDTAAAAVVLKSWATSNGPRFFANANEERSGHIRSVEFRVSSAAAPRGTALSQFRVAAFESTYGISEDTELLFASVAVAAPLILLLSLAGGYVMAARALRPVTELSAAVARIAPDELSLRLPVQEPQDELGELAAEFNALLARLNSAQSQNRRFLREAAHQIRTPLTLVLGEAALELQTTDESPKRMRDSFTRIGLAAERMRRRVDELFLLAEAQAGEKVLLKEIVDLDEILLQVVDLMRPRAAALGRVLAIGNASHAPVHGSPELLHEAVLEMLENAVRHGDATRAVTVSVTVGNDKANLVVESGGQTFVLPPATDEQGPSGLGIPIVRWVAEVHHGELTLEGHPGWNALTLAIPVAT
jgi:signal transduction histidine kinase